MYFCCDSGFHGRNNLRAVRLMTLSPKQGEKSEAMEANLPGIESMRLKSSKHHILGSMYAIRYIYCVRARFFACMIPSSEVSLLGANTCPRWLAVWVAGGGVWGWRQDSSSRDLLATKQDLRLNRMRCTSLCCPEGIGGNEFRRSAQEQIEERNPEEAFGRALNAMGLKSPQWDSNHMHSCFRDHFEKTGLSWLQSLKIPSTSPSIAGEFQSVVLCSVNRIASLTVASS